VPKGKIDVLPEIFPQLESWLPRRVTIVSSEQYGGAMRVEIEGEEIEEGVGYQLIVTESPMSRLIELVKNPHQDG